VAQARLQLKLKLYSRLGYINIHAERYSSILRLLCPIQDS
jgi:hypothetical protein